MIRRLIARPEFGPLVLLVAELFVFWAINPDFLSPLNISNTLAFTVELGLIALAMTLLMTSGEFDLSVGSVFGFCPVLMWTLFNGGMTSLEVGVRHRAGRRRPDRAGQRAVRDAAEDPVLPGDARHAAGGARHRAVHHRRLPAAHLERRRPVAGRRCWSATSTSARSASTCRCSGSSLAAIVLGYVLTQTKFGNWIQASGGNANAARARGVNVDRTKVVLFMLSAVLSAFAGIISSIRTSAANPNSGTGYELEVIAMVVIGGTALTGGRGTIIGTVIGIFILRVMRNGIVLIGVPGLAYNIFIGAIILGMMALHSWPRAPAPGGELRRWPKN